jgi:bifunctional DNA-binding transcriptional regulator/antitoxin component of YhaV-PrlF toxin-antitoxin module
MNAIDFSKEISYTALMKTAVTITSKRQLTIPKKIWEQLDLDGVKYLQAEIKDGALELHKINFSSQLDKFWSKTNGVVKGQLSDASIKQASHEARQSKLIA